MQELSFEEVNRMRQIVQNFDASRRPMTTTDLNNPPKEPYRFQKFPMMVYQGKQTAIVQSEDELQDALADGWSQEAPAATEVEAETLSPKYQMEVQQVQEKLAESRKRKAKEVA